MVDAYWQAVLDEAKAKKARKAENRAHKLKLAADYILKQSRLKKRRKKHHKRDKISQQAGYELYQQRQHLASIRQEIKQTA